MGRTSNANERLMDAALALMWEESYGAVSIDDICRRANVKKGSFYYFFASKSELAVEALERYWQQLKPVMDRIFSPSAAPLDRIRAKCEHTYQTQREVQQQTGQVLGCRLCCLGSEICTQDPAIRGKVVEILERERRYWESAIRDGQADGVIPPGDTSGRARCALAYFSGLVAQARLTNDIDLLRELPQRVIEHVQGAARASAA